MRAADIDFVDRWVVCFTGWHQEGRISGMEKIQDAIHRQCNADDTRVLLKSWKDDPSDLANRIWNRRPVSKPTRIVVVGFSYGGWTAVLFCAELERRGLTVEVLLLIDPVWRPIRWLPSPTSLLRFWKIEVPANVQMVYHWYQDISRLRGHKVRLADEQKTTLVEVKLTRPHHAIDDAPVIFEKALSVACPGNVT